MNNKQTIHSLIIILTILLLTASTSGQVRAQSPTPKASSPSATATGIIDKLKKIEILKEKIATKVAELREKEKGAVFGTIKKLDKLTITILGKTYESSVSFSEDTIFYALTGGTRAETNTKKLKEGAIIAALGYFDESRTLLSAKYIYFTSTPTHIIVKIADIDKNNYTITIKGNQGNIMVDVETYSRTFSYTKKSGITKIGFSKLKVGDIVHVTGAANPTEENRIAATRIYAFSFGTQLLPTPKETKETSPSATPIKKKTPTPASD